MPRSRSHWWLHSARGRTKAIGLGCATFLLALAVGLIATELILRSAGVVPWGVAVHVRWMFTQAPDGTILTTPGWRGRHKVEGRTVEIRLNSLGLRGPDLPDRKDPEEQRVLVLGDSFVWGYGMVQEETFCHRLELGLRHSTGHAVRVGNAGAPSYGLLKQVATLRRVERAFEPDVVVACVFLGNDFVDDLRQAERIFDGYRLEGWSARFIDASWRARNMVRFRTALLVEKWLARHMPALAIGPSTLAALSPDEYPPSFFMDGIEETDDVRGCLDRSQGALAMLRELAAPAPVLVVAITTESHLSEGAFESYLAEAGLDPTRYRRGLAVERLARLSQSLGLRFLDLTPRLAGEPDRARAWQPVGKHFSILGHAKVAAWLEPIVAELLEARPSGSAASSGATLLQRR